MYTEEVIEKKIEQAHAANLTGAELLDDRERAMRVCNGIGAAWMPEWMRDTISQSFPALVVVAFIHDIHYEAGGGVLDRWKADWTFLANGFRMAIFTRNPRVIYWTLLMWIFLRAGGAAAFHWRTK